MNYKTEVVPRPRTPNILVVPFGAGLWTGYSKDYFRKFLIQPRGTLVRFDENDWECLRCGDDEVEITTIHMPVIYLAWDRESLRFRPRWAGRNIPFIYHRCVHCDPKLQTPDFQAIIEVVDHLPGPYRNFMTSRKVEVYAKKRTF